MNQQTHLQRCLQLLTLLVATGLMGCGGGSVETTASLPPSDTVGAPIGADPQPAAPQMGLLEPVPRSTALAAPAPNQAEEAANVWVRDEARPELAPSANDGAIDIPVDATYDPPAQETPVAVPSSNDAAQPVAPGASNAAN